MTIDFYYMAMSPPCRAVLLTAKAVDINLNMKEINLLNNENKTPEYTAINPQQTIPAIVDGNLRLWESRAICSYLASQYGKDDSLYPNDPRARALVDARLQFDMGTLYRRWFDYEYPVYKKEEARADPVKLEKVHEALVLLNTFLMEYPWAAGNNITVADFCLVATVSSIESVDVDLNKYTKITAWLKQCKNKMVDYQEANGDGVAAYGAFLKPILEAE